MKKIEISDDLADAIEAIAAYERRPAAEVVAPVLARLVEDHHGRLREVLEQLQPTTAAPDPRNCIAQSCKQRRIARDAKLCAHHTTVMRDMVASLRPRFGADAPQEALARLADGRSAAL